MADRGPGDGDFRWWWCEGHYSSVDTFNGPCDTREAAIAEARQSIADNFDAGGFSVIEADKLIPHPHFDADQVLESYADANGDCWGEDGPEIFAEDDAKRELESALCTVLADWFQRHGIEPRTWTFATMRNQEHFADAPVEGGI
jgi:hypothetical protein